MMRQIQILIVEDNPVDAELLVHELRRAKFEIKWHRVDTEKDYLAGLRSDLDLIFSDFELPGFNGLRALELLNEKGYEIPFIIVSGAIGEETAVKAIKLGATDYLLKDRIARLGAAVTRALREGQERIERKQAEEQLLWKTALLEAQVNSTLDGILIVDGDGKKILQNQRVIDLWNIPKDIAAETSHKRRLEWIAGQNKNPRQFAEKVAYLYAHPDEVSRDELELVNGTFIDRYSAPVRGKDGKYYGRIWVYRDITDQKRAEAQIVEQANFLNKARDAIVVCDLNGKIVYWNKGAERMYGWTYREALDRKVDELFYADAKKAEEIKKAAIDHDEWHGELQHFTKDRRELNVEARCTLIRDNKGGPKAILEIDTDITERKKIEAQFMRAQRIESIGTLAGGIAHDLNNILAPIVLSLDLLKPVTTDADARIALETIEISARRGTDVVQQVLSFARGMEGRRVEVQLKYLIKDLEHIIKDTFPKDIRTELILSGELWTIMGDPTQIHQILLNLCVNARDAMPHGGKLVIGAENHMLDSQYVAMNTEANAGPYVVLSVTDSGTGIPPGLIEKIFEPFFTTKDPGKGTGLGLSTVMAIVKSHNGFINIYSESNAGTTFKVYLPAERISIGADEEPSQEVHLPQGNGETILIIDDETSILTITGQTLQAHGYRILKAANGAEALAIYAKNEKDIDVVLTDMAMPVMDGPATIYALLKINPCLKIIAASGLHSMGGEGRAIDAGTTHFLTKPYTAEALLKTLRVVLDEVA